MGAIRVLAWLAVGVVVALLSALLSAVLVGPAYQQPRDGSTASGRGDVAAPARAPGASPAAAPGPAPAGLPDDTPAGPVAVARRFIQHLAAAAVPQALSLTIAADDHRGGGGETGTDEAGPAATGPERDGRPDPKLLREWVRLAPVADAAGILPGASAAGTEVLVWAAYDLDGQPRRGFFRFVLRQTGERWRIAAVSGPVTPAGGYLPFPYPALDPGGREIAAAARRGPLVLWAPRDPEPGLVGQMEALRRRWAGAIDVVLALDLGAPAGWERYARSQGWLGAVWRVKGDLARIPLPALWSYRGACGVLVDRGGLVVAPVGALDPARYGLGPGDWAAVADQVAAAYNLMDLMDGGDAG